jgi:hypothetical protein
MASAGELSVADQLDYMQAIKRQETGSDVSFRRLLVQETARIFCNMILLRANLLPHQMSWARFMELRDRYVTHGARGMQIHICNDEPEQCHAESLPAGMEFVSLFDGRTYKATGTIFVCSLTGHGHRCDETHCNATRANPDQLGTKSCPISKRYKGSTLNDALYNTRIDHDAGVLAENGEVHLDLDLPVTYQDTPKKRRRPGSGGPSKRSGRAGSVGTEEPVISAAQRSEIDAFVTKIFKVGPIRESLLRTKDSISYEAERRWNEMKMENRRAALSDKPLRQMDFFTACNTIVSKYPVGMTSIQRLCAGEKIVPRDDELKYISKCIRRMFLAMKRSSWQISTSGAAKKKSGSVRNDVNIKNGSLSVLYMIMDGVVGYRSVSASRAYTYVDIKINVGSDATEQVVDGETYDAHDNLRQRFVFSPPHPGLGMVVPEQDVLSRGKIAGLDNEKNSLMKRQRAVQLMLTQILQECADPSQFCLETVLRGKLKTDIFLDRSMASASN